MKTNLMKRYKGPRISVVMYLLEHVEIVNLVNLEGETPLYCATLLRDDRKLFDLMCEKIHQRKLAVECKLAAARLVRATPSTKSLNQFHNQTFQNENKPNEEYNVPRISVVMYLLEHVEIEKERPHCTVLLCFEMIGNFLI